jgi:hypothetical protein
MKEPRVREHLVRWLSSRGYTNITMAPQKGRPPSKPKGRGRPSKSSSNPDIKGNKGTSYYYIEAKGDPPSTTKIYTAIGELCTKKAATTPTTYAIGFPISFAPYILNLLSPRAWKRLEVKILLVSNSGEVAEYSPSKASLQKMKGLRAT